MFMLIVGTVILLFSLLAKNIGAQTIKMTVAQAGVNPGTSLYFIAQKENLFAKHGLEVKIVDTTTPAAVQAMLGGSMSLTLGAGPPGICHRDVGRRSCLRRGFLLGECVSLRSGRSQGNREDTRLERQDRTGRRDLRIGAGRCPAIRAKKDGAGP